MGTMAAHGDDQDSHHTWRQTETRWFGRFPAKAGSKSKMHEENLRPNVGEGWDGSKSVRLRDEREGGSG